MVWDGITCWYSTDIVVVQGNLTAVHYRDEILRPHVVPLMRNHADIELFQHDNATPHKACLTTQLLADSRINVVD